MATPVLEVRDLSYAYPDRTQALSGVSLALHAGETVGLIGPNGAGKSTLLLHLNGLLPEHLPREGAGVLVDGEPVTKRRLGEVRRRVGLLFQDPNDQLFCPTVWDDVAFGPQQLGLPKDAVAARVESALKRVSLWHLAKKLPQHLSGGEKRRACLAGVLACEPSVLILDEPTTHLDPRGRRELIALLRELPLAKLIATHDLDMVAALCSRVIVLDGGRVVADGAAESLMRDERLMLEHGLEVPGCWR